MSTSSTATIRTKRFWERAQAALEVVSIVAGIVATVGLWFEGWREFGPRLVFGGVAVEVFAAMWILLASRKLQNILEEELGRVSLLAAQAIERAGETKKGLIEAERNLEQEHTARLKLEAQLAWRQITRAQEDLIIKWLSAYKDAPMKTFCMIDVSAYGPDPEAIQLASQLAKAIGKSGCRTSLEQPSKFGLAPIGIAIEYKPAEEDQWKGNQWANISLGIASALERVGLFVLPVEPFKYVDPRTTHLDAPIRVIVGKH